MKAFSACPPLFVALLTPVFGSRMHAPRRADCNVHTDKSEQIKPTGLIRGQFFRESGVIRGGASAPSASTTTSGSSNTFASSPSQGVRRRNNF